LRFDALTIPRPGKVNEMEWSEVDWDTERWTIPATKMKTGWDHVVPLSRQALAILRSVQKLTGHRRYVRDFLFCIRELRHRILAMTKSFHEAVRDALQSIGDEYVEPNRYGHGLLLLWEVFQTALFSGLV
jgi:integrase